MLPKKTDHHHHMFMFLLNESLSLYLSSTSMPFTPVTSSELLFPQSNNCSLSSSLRRYDLYKSGQPPPLYSRNRFLENKEKKHVSSCMSKIWKPRTMSRLREVKKTKKIKITKIKGLGISGSSSTSAVSNRHVESLPLHLATTTSVPSTTVYDLSSFFDLQGKPI